MFTIYNVYYSHPIFFILIPNPFTDQNMFILFCASFHVSLNYSRQSCVGDIKHIGLCGYFFVLAYCELYSYL